MVYWRGEKSIMTIELDYGEGAMALSFLKVLRRQMPKQDEIVGRAIQVSEWIYNNSTSEEQREIEEAGLKG